MPYSTIWLTVVAHWTLAASPPPEASGQVWRFDVPRQGAAEGIAAFSRQATTVQLLVSQDSVRGRRTNRLFGTYSLEAALTALLRGSGLRWLRTGPTTYSLVVTAKDFPR